MLRKILAVLMLFASLPAWAEADDGSGFWLELQKVGGSTSSALLTYDKKFTETFGAYALAFRDSSGYETYYAGPKMKLTSWLEAGIAVGRENKPRGIRRNLQFSIDSELVKVYATFENGASGPWHKITVMRPFGEKWSFGTHNEKFVGWGGRAEYAIDEKSSGWMAIVYDRQALDLEAEKKGKWRVVGGINRAF